MIKIFVAFLTYTDGEREFYNIYPDMIKAIEEAENALAEDEEIENVFLCYDMITPRGRHTMRTYTIKR